MASVGSLADSGGCRFRSFIVISLQKHTDPDMGPQTDPTKTATRLASVNHTCIGRATPKFRRRTVYSPAEAGSPLERDNASPSGRAS